MAERSGLRLFEESLPKASGQAFPDGADFRIEIPSVEGPEVLEAVITTARANGVTVNRASQGSGAMLLTQRELSDMAAMGAEEGIEVCLFVGPREGFDVGHQARAADGASISGQIRGSRQLRYAVEDIMRSLECGIRSFLIADSGLLEVVATMQKDGEIPADVVWKVSVMMAPSNIPTFLQLDRMGASTVNVPSDMALPHLAELRASSSVPMDLYVEAPDSMGGVVRGNEVGEIVAIAAPIYIKYGLRNARNLYPSGEHLREEAMAIAREKVHRAAVSMEWLQRSHPHLEQSKPGAAGLGIPTRPSAAVPPR
jgi:hypothetical protein